jgi:hypothetical protein
MSSNPEKIYTYQEKIESLSESLNSKIAEFEAYIDKKSNMERDVALLCLDFLKKNQNCKFSNNKIEMLACLNDRELYGNLIYYRHIEKSANKVIEAVEQSISAIQSCMKYDKPYER